MQAIKAPVISLFTLTLSIVLSACGSNIQITQVPCDGSTSYITTPCAEAYPLYANEWTAKLNLTLEGLKKLAKASGGTEFGNKVVRLAQELDQINVGVILAYRASCDLFNSRPCDPEITRARTDMLKQILDAQIKLREIDRKADELLKAKPPPTGVPVLALDPRLRLVNDLEDRITELKDILPKK